MRLNTNRRDQLSSPSVADTSASPFLNFLIYIKVILQIFWLMVYSCFYFLKYLYSIISPSDAKKIEKTDVILVTGGANGIGREICLQLAKLEKSATIISWDVDQKANDQIVKELKSLGVQKAFGFKVDVIDRDEVIAMAEKIRSDIGHVSILINNAGILGEIRKIWEMSPATVRKVFDTNLVSHTWTLQTFLPSMIDKGRGHIVEICSVAAFLPSGFLSPYIGSKQGLLGFIEAIKEDVRTLPSKPKIDFTIVYPFITQTALAHRVDYRVGKNAAAAPRHIPASFVASKVVEGILQNKEHVYVPGIMRYVHMIYFSIPPPVIRKFFDIFQVDMRERE